MSLGVRSKCLKVKFSSIIQKHAISAMNPNLKFLVSAVICKTWWKISHGLEEHFGQRFGGSCQIWWNCEYRKGPWSFYAPFIWKCSVCLKRAKVLLHISTNHSTYLPFSWQNIKKWWMRSTVNVKLFTKQLPISSQHAELI